MDFNDLPGRLKQAREFTGKSQREFADLLGVSFRGLQTYESGKSVPGGSALISYAQQGFSVNWILLGVGSMLLAPQITPKTSRHDDRLLLHETLELIPIVDKALRDKSFTDRCRLVLTVSDALKSPV